MNDEDLGMSRDSYIANGLEARGATIVAYHRTDQVETIDFCGTPEILDAMTLGNTRAWRQLIADNQPHADGKLYIRLENVAILRSFETEIRVLMPDEVAT